LQDELIKIWGLRKVTVIPVIIGALRCLSNDSRKYLDEVDPKIKTEVIQKTALLGTARITRKVLSL